MHEIQLSPHAFSLICLHRYYLQVMAQQARCPTLPNKTTCNSIHDSLACSWSDTRSFCTPDHMSSMLRPLLCKFSQLEALLICSTLQEQGKYSSLCGCMLSLYYSIIDKYLLVLSLQHHNSLCTFSYTQYVPLPMTRCCCMYSVITQQQVKACAPTTIAGMCMSSPSCVSVASDDSCLPKWMMDESKGNSKALIGLRSKYTAQLFAGTHATHTSHCYSYRPVSSCQVCKWQACRLLQTNVA